MIIYKTGDYFELANFKRKPSPEWWMNFFELVRIWSLTSFVLDAEGEAGADDEYLSVAAGLHNGTIDDGLDSGSDIEL